MIITHLKGGLGNQMFQYACGYSLARENNNIHKLDISHFSKIPTNETKRSLKLSVKFWEEFLKHLFSQ